MKNFKTIALCFLLNLLALATAFAQAGVTIARNTAAPMPRILERNGRHELLVDDKPYFILGGQAHNSSGWPAMLPAVWQAIEVMHANTLEVPVYWEQVEARPGAFDFSIVDTLLGQARQHGVRLVLLWFGTWKNGSNHYMPAWMKRDAGKYPDITGKNGQPVDSPSPFAKDALQADINAFTALMLHLKDADPLHTVIMVQVENESGTWDSVRDYSAVAQRLFQTAVPAALLNPEVLKALHVPVVAGGTWRQVFGDRADEYFHAWWVARYVGQVAAAGKAAYPLPLYVNAALRDPLSNPMANTYESGGPTDNVIPIWKVAAPAIDLEAPDIYLEGSERILKVLELYDRPDNALFVPEAGLRPVNAKYLYAVIARGGIGFSPFGIDDNGSGETAAETAERLAPFARDYALAAAMEQQLAQWAFDGRIKAVVEHEDQAAQTIDLGKWQAIVSFGSDRRDAALKTEDKPGGKMMIVQLDADKFLLIGALCHVTFKPAGPYAGRAWQYLEVNEGRYENGKFKFLRILNGDETDFGGPRLGETPEVLQTTLVLR